MRDSARYVATALVIALACAGVALAGGNSLTVTTPGLGGSAFKMTATSTGVDNNQVWVQDNTPVCEPTYNFEFQMSTPGLLLDPDDKVQAILVR